MQAQETREERFDWLADEETVAYPLAGFAARTVAFSLDVLPFAIAALLQHIYAPSPLLGLIWFALFLVYQAFFAAEGRQTWGKSLLGLRVFAADGTPLTLPRSLARSFGHFLSGSFLGLGYLWAIIFPGQRAWHDILSRSMVVETVERRRWGRAVVAAGAWASIAIFALAWVWTVLGAPAARDARRLADADKRLRLVAVLEMVQHDRTGAYTADIGTLGRLYGDEAGLRSALSSDLEPRSLRLERAGGLLVIEGVAKDSRHTILRVKTRAA